MRLTHLVVSKADASALSLGTGILDEFGENKHAEEEDSSQNGEDSAGNLVLRADLEPATLKT